MPNDQQAIGSYESAVAQIRDGYREIEKFSPSLSSLLREEQSGVIRVADPAFQGTRRLTEDSPEKLTKCLETVTLCQKPVNALVYINERRFAAEQDLAGQAVAWQDAGRPAREAYDGRNLLNVPAAEMKSYHTNRGYWYSVDRLARLTVVQRELNDYLKSDGGVVRKLEQVGAAPLQERVGLGESFVVSGRTIVGANPDSALPNGGEGNVRRMVRVDNIPGLAPAALEVTINEAGQIVPRALDAANAVEVLWVPRNNSEARNPWVRFTLEPGENSAATRSQIADLNGGWDGRNLVFRITGRDGVPVDFKVNETSVRPQGGVFALKMEVAKVLRQ